MHSVKKIKINNIIYVNAVHCKCWFYFKKTDNEISIRESLKLFLFAKTIHAYVAYVCMCVCTNVCMYTHIKALITPSKPFKCDSKSSHCMQRYSLYLDMKLQLLANCSLATSLGSPSARDKHVHAHKKKIMIRKAVICDGFVSMKDSHLKSSIAQVVLLMYFCERFIWMADL